MTREHIDLNKCTCMNTVFESCPKHFAQKSYVNIRALLSNNFSFFWD